ncbi:MAG: ATP-binding cassette domain-containing protein [Flavobacteriales bacterium]|nr:ATP-binding cassette domain-containing protein [Flavobacteriales bacterium]MDW8409828.1 ATP-binding cassette domain-containing protein [Flavobacteriales bacterium]
MTSFKEAVHQLFSGRVFQRKEVLRNIHFTLYPGECLAVVGRNGSGKTTLLRLVCGITEPETGRIVRRGTLAPVLSLGAGLEPELTGLENIHLLSALAGFSQEEEKQLPARVMAFSELSPEVLRMQVKRYSTGMMARLSFALAMARKPDLLVVDEALAVGDAAFQDKCYQAIEEHIRRGGSLMLVSHAAAEVKRLCNRMLVLEKGQIQFDGSPDEGLRCYQNILSEAPF